MGLTEAELLERRVLVDQILSYHFVPGVAITDSEKAAGAISKDPSKPTILDTASVDASIKMSRSPATGIYTLADEQGNTAIVVNNKHKMLGKIAIWPISAVLMSNTYFDNADSLLRFYPELSTANELKSRAITAGTPLANVWLGATPSTFFVPTNDALAPVAMSLAKSDTVQLAKIFELHVVPGLKAVPSGFKSGSAVDTLLPGAKLKTTITDTSDTDLLTGEKIAVPVLSVQGPGNAKPATVTIPNLYAGKSVVQVVDGALLPASAAPAAASGRKLLQGSSQASRRAISQQWAGQNTQRAIAEAARGNIPASYATRSGTRNANLAGCLNCQRWGTVF